MSGADMTMSHVMSGGCYDGESRDFVTGAGKTVSHVMWGGVWGLV